LVIIRLENFVEQFPNNDSITVQNSITVKKF